MDSALRCVTARSGSSRCDASTWCSPCSTSMARISASDRRQSCASGTTLPSSRMRLAMTCTWSPWLTMAKPSKAMPRAHRVPMARHSSSVSARSSGPVRSDWCATWTPTLGRRACICAASLARPCASVQTNVPPMTSARGLVSPLWSRAPIKYLDSPTAPRPLMSLPITAGRPVPAGPHARPARPHAGQPGRAPSRSATPACRWPGG